MIQDLRYDYDNAGNILTITDDLRRPGVNYSQGFTYDHLNRLKTASVISQLEGQIVYTYGYDKIGNIKSVTNSGGSNPYPNLARRYPRTIHYNYDNLPYEILTNQVVLASFTYDYTGKRVSKTTGATTTLYIGDIYESTGGVCTNHIFAGGRRIASKTTGGAVIYYHADHLGSLNAATSNGTNGPQETVAYNPFGEVRLDAGNVNLDYKFTGKEYDPEAGGGAGATDGLYYYGARYYDPVVGRFISPNTFVQNPGDPQSLNRYAYCRNNPLLYTDPTGHFFGLDFLFAMAAGSLFGGTMAAIQGQDIGMGFLTGAISGAAFFVAGEAGGGAITHSIAGAASGAVNSAITGGNIGMGALTGGISAGVAEYAGGFIPGDPASQLVGRSVIGGITGGITAQLYGGSFSSGFANGFRTGAIGYVCNHWVHERLNQVWTRYWDNYDQIVNNRPQRGRL